MARKKKSLQQLQTLPIDRIEPPERASARSYPEDSIEELAQFMARNGLMEPVLVTANPGGQSYRLILGQRRLLAARRIGWKDMPAIVLGELAAEELRTIRGLQENHFDPWRLADVLETMKTRWGWTQAQLGLAIGKSRDFVANILAIRQIRPEVRQYLTENDRTGEITSRHLRYVGRAPEDEQMLVARRILGLRLSTTRLEREKRGVLGRTPEFRFIKVRELRKAGSPHAPKTLKDWRKYYRQITTDLRRIDRQESLETRRARARMAEAKLRQRQVKKEANQRRQELGRELRRVVKALTRLRPS